MSQNKQRKKFKINHTQTKIEIFFATKYTKIERENMSQTDNNRNIKCTTKQTKI